MSVENEHVRDLMAGALRLADAIEEATREGLMLDPDGTLANICIELRDDAARVELVLDPEPDDSHDVGYNTAADDHLEAQVENDLGDVEGDGGW